jgi:hypothetical protein
MYVLLYNTNRRLSSSPETPNPSIERMATGLARRAVVVYLPSRRAKPASAAHVKR